VIIGQMPENPPPRNFLHRSAITRADLNLTIINISIQHVSFSILIGHNSAAEWLIVASTYH